MKLRPRSIPPNIAAIIVLLATIVASAFGRKHETAVSPCEPPPEPASLTAAHEAALPAATDSALARIVAKADAIVVAQCADQQSRWNADGRLIHTYSTFTVEQCVVGSLPAGLITVRTLGGSVGSISQMAVGAVQFRSLERDVLFLTRSEEPDVFQPVGVTQGRIEVGANPTTGEVVVVTGGISAEGGPSEPLGEPIMHSHESGNPSAAHGAAGQPLTNLLKAIRQLRAPDTKGDGRCD